MAVHTCNLSSSEGEMKGSLGLTVSQPRVLSKL